MDSNRERTSTLSDGAATVHDASTNIAATVDAYATLAAYLRSHKFDIASVDALESLPLDACLSQDRPALLESLKACGVALIKDRQLIAKAVATERRAREAAVVAAEAAAAALLPPPPLRPALPDRRDLVPPPPPPLRCPPSRSQDGFCQDIRCLQYYDYKCGGFYLEIGIDSCIKNNNTYLLDEVYGWRGVAVDPNFQDGHKRTCAIYKVALASESGTAQFAMAGPLSGLAEFAQSSVHNSMWHEALAACQTVQVETRTPRELLEASNCPKHIDYLSLDVEGSEMDILEAFPFEDYTIGFATIETNNDKAKEKEIRELMLSHGYTFLGHAAVDDYFCFGEPRRRTFGPALDYS